MKILSIFLSIYMLALSFVPCADTCIDACKSISTTTECVVDCSTDCDNHKESEEDNCTPFCTCNCCGQTFTARYFFSEQKSFLIKVLHENPKSFYQFPAGRIYNLIVWQPPKFC